MANDLTKNPWIIDTAAATVLHTGRVHVKSIRWAGTLSSAADDDVEVQDQDGATLWISTAAGANHNEEAILETQWRNGFKVPTLDVGKLYITYR